MSWSNGDVLVWGWRGGARFSVLAILLVLAAGLHPTAVKAQVRAAEVQFPPAAMMLFHLDQGDTAIIYAVAGSSPSDPAAHLFRMNASDEYQQVAYNDNYNSELSSYIAYTETGGGADFMCVVRSRSWSTAGDVTIYSILGTQMQDYVSTSVGCVGLSAALFAQGTTETLQTAEVPGGSTFPAVIPVSSSTWMGSPDPYSYCYEPVLVGGIGGAVKTEAYGAGGYLFLSPNIYTNDEGTWEYVPSRSGWGSVYINDASDDDEDGLGNALESALQTCPSDQSCPYSGTGSSVDTDRDGLLDGEEVFGACAVGAGGTCEMTNGGYDEVSLPRWGANPLHKDMFLQFNYFEGTTGAPNPFSGLSSMDDWADEFANLFSEGDSSVLLNPDGEDGISVHLDVGIQPSTASRESLYGNYPRLSARAEPPFTVWVFQQSVSSWNGDVLVQVTDGTQVAYDLFSDGDVLSAKASTEPSAYAGYLYDVLLSKTSGWGSLVLTRDYGVLSIEVADPSIASELETLLWCKPDGTSAWSNCSTLGLIQLASSMSDARRNHYLNPYYTDSVRVGMMRYASVTSGSGGQTTRYSRAIVAGISDPETPAHEFGHCLGIGDGGTPAPGGYSSIGKCPPNYNSIMSYAGGDGFYSADDEFEVNPANISETDDIPSDSCAFASYMGGAPWYLETFTSTPPGACYPDWNRSGTLETGGLQGPIGMARSSGCRAFVAGEQKLVLSGHYSRGYHVLARGGNYMYLFTIEPDGSSEKVVYRRAPLGSKQNESCTGTADSCLSFSAPATLLTGSDFGGLAAYYWDDYLHVAMSDVGSQSLRLWRYTVDPATGTLLNGSETTATGPALESPELVVRYDGTAPGTLVCMWSIVFGTGSVYIERAYDASSNSWGTTNFMYTCQPSLLGGSGTPAAVAWPDPYNTTASYGFRRTCGIFPDSSGAGLFYCYDVTNQCWEDYTSQGFPVYSNIPPYDISCPHNSKLVQYQVGGVTRDICVLDAVKPLELAFIPMRNDSGQQIDASQGKGNFILVFYTPGNGCQHEAPAIWWSSEVDSSNFVGSSSLWSDPGTSQHWRDYAGGEWSCLQEQGNWSVYLDETMGSAMGLVSYYSDQKSSLRFEPFADGSPPLDYLPMSDFAVMELYLCDSLRTSDSYRVCE